VIKFNVLLLNILLSIISSATQNVEKSFLQNNPQIFYSQLSTQTNINISLPDPISFSDQLSDQQAYFLFRQIFSTYSTFEFYPERELALLPGEKNFIFKARWSFLNRKNSNQYVFRVFFYFINESSAQNSYKFKSSWKIAEIKAEKI